MLVFSHAQLSQLQRALDQRLLAKVLANLRGRIPPPSAHLSQPALAERVGAAVARALSFPVRDDDHVTEFAWLDLMFGPSFHRHPVCASVLSNPLIHPDAKMAALLRKMTPADWESISAFPPR